MNKTVLLTGGTGFLGRHLVEALVADGIRVRLPVRHEHTIAPHPLVQVVRTTDLFKEDVAALQSLLADVDIVIHAAWYTVPKDYLSSSKNIDCLTGTLNLARAYAEMGGARFVGIGSFFEYDSSYGYLRTSTPLCGKTLYAHCKIAAWNILQSYFSDKSTEFLWLRMFGLYGMDMNSGEHSSRIVPYLHQRLSRGEVAELSAGTQVRDYLEIREAARRVTNFALGRAQGAVNICSGKGTTVRELAEHIADQYGRRDLLQFGIRDSNFYDPQYIVGEIYRHTS